MARTTLTAEPGAGMVPKWPPATVPGEYMGPTNPKATAGDPRLSDPRFLAAASLSCYG